MLLNINKLIEYNFLKSYSTNYVSLNWWWKIDVVPLKNNIPPQFRCCNMTLVAAEEKINALNYIIHRIVILCNVPYCLLLLLFSTSK